MVTLRPISFLQLELGLINQTASGLFNSQQHIYKNWDYRCLVPYSHKDPTKWKTYDNYDYRNASSEEELKSVDQLEYDNNFFNFVDPKVLKYFTNSTESSEKAWKDTYGFPYVTTIPWNSKYFTAVLMKCWEKCASLEESSYYNMILSLRTQFSRRSPASPKTVERMVAFSSVALNIIPWPSLRSLGTV